jgi:PiT family inorganic phosphate transporter
VLRALAISPVLGLVGAGLLYFVIRHLVHDRHLYEPPKGDQPPVGWVRGLLILTCTTVSFSHGSNDGQKSIGLIMLTIIGIMPATFALNPKAETQISQLAQNAAAAEPLIAKYGDDEKKEGLEAVARLKQAGPEKAAIDGTFRPEFLHQAAEQAGDAGPGIEGEPKKKENRSALRDEIYRIVGELKYVVKSKDISKEEKAEAGRIRDELRPTVEYAPWWVRALSALCLGIGTMVGYRRIVKTLGERVGKAHLTPAQGASAELVGALLIGSAGFTGLPVSTTHIITSGIAGTMLGSGAGINPAMLTRIALAWVLTLPITVAVSAGLFYAMS